MLDTARPRRLRPTTKAWFFRFRRDTQGVAAVEFGLIAGVFILLMCFLIEVGLTMFMATSLDRAVRKESRLIKTGVITSSGAATLAANLCADLQFIMTCSRIQSNVASAASFAALSSTVTTDATNTMTGTGFNPGTSGQNVIMQVGYTRPIYLPIVSSFMGKGGNVFIYSALAFQNEPF